MLEDIEKRLSALEEQLSPKEPEKKYTEKKMVSGAIMKVPIKEE